MDSLTGLKNRNSLFHDAQELIRKNQRFYLIFIDLDCFKQVNDLYGHLAGDEYLCVFAGKTEKFLKNQGMLYRMSGDEFICLFMEKDPEEFLEKLSHLSFSVTVIYRLRDAAQGALCFRMTVCRWTSRFLWRIKRCTVRKIRSTAAE